MIVSPPTLGGTQRIARLLPAAGAKVSVSVGMYVSCAPYAAASSPATTSFRGPRGLRTHGQRGGGGVRVGCGARGGLGLLTAGAAPLEAHDQPQSGGATPFAEGGAGRGLRASHLPLSATWLQLVSARSSRGVSFRKPREVAHQMKAGCAKKGPELDPWAWRHRGVSLRGPLCAGEAFLVILFGVLLGREGVEMRLRRD